MPTASTNGANVQIETAAPEASVGQVLMAEIARRLPDTFGMTAAQGKLLFAEFQTMAVMGAFYRVRSHGATLFELASNWEDLGVAEKGARAKMFRRPPPKYLAPPGTMEPFQSIVGSMRHALDTYGTYYEWLRARWVPYKADPKLWSVYHALGQKFTEKRVELVERLDEIRAFAVERMKKSAAEAYAAYVATTETRTRRDEFIDRVVERMEMHFPTPADIEAKLRMELVDILPPDMRPTKELIDAVLGIKDAVEAEAQERQARAQQAEIQLEFAEWKRDQDETLIREINARRYEMEVERERRLVEEQFGPIADAMQHVRDLLADDVFKMLQRIRDGDDISKQLLGAMRRKVELCKLVSVGEMRLEAAIAELEPVLNAPAKSRNVNQLKDALEEVAEIVSADLMRAQVRAYEHVRWNQLLVGDEQAHG